MLISICCFTDFDLLIEFLERYISSDGVITSKYFVVTAIYLFPLYYFLIFILSVNLLNFFKLFPIKLSIYLLIYLIIFFTHLIIHLNANNIFNQTIKEDGFLEYATVGMSILAAILFFFAGVFRVRCAFFLGANK